MHITTNPLKMIMSAYHTIKKLGHNIVLKEIQHLTGILLIIIYLETYLSFGFTIRWACRTKIKIA
jgi:hypothetical protein